MFLDEQSESIAKSLKDSEIKTNQTANAQINPNNNNNSYANADKDNLYHYDELGINDSLLGNQGRALFLICLCNFIALGKNLRLYSHNIIIKNFFIYFNLKNDLQIKQDKQQTPMRISLQAKIGDSLATLSEDLSISLLLSFVKGKDLRTLMSQWF